MRTLKLLAAWVCLIALLAVSYGCSGGSGTSASSGGAGGGTGGSTSSATALGLTASVDPIGPAGTTIISAHAVDSLGGDVVDGTTIKFAFVPGDQLKARLSASSATTVNGYASITMTATSTVDTIVTINATSGTASNTKSITITAGTAGGSVIVTAATATITVSGSVGVTATIVDASGNPVNNATVNFSLNNNTIATLSPTTSATNALGVASTTVTAIAAGSLTINATVPNLPGVPVTSAYITITAPSNTPTIVLSTASSILTYGTTTIYAQLSGFSPLVGLTVNFSVSQGATLSSPSAVTNTNGLAEVALTATNVVMPVTVTATYPGQGVLTGTTTITITAPLPDSVTLSINPTSITTYGTARIEATVTGNMHWLPDGTQVNFGLSNGTFGQLSNVIGSTANGVATTTFTAANQSGSAPIIATVGNVSNTATIAITPAATGSIQFNTAVPQVIGLQGSGAPEQSKVTFYVVDSNGNPVADGTNVDFTMKGPGGGAYIGATFGKTTASASTVIGEASVYLHSGNVAGPVTIIATTAAGTGVISSSASQISIGGGAASASHWNLSTDVFNLPGLIYSGEQAKISAFVADRFGNYNILSGTVINFYTEGGAIDRQGVMDLTLDASGSTSVTLRTQYPMPSNVLTTTSTATLSTIFTQYFSSLTNTTSEPNVGVRNPRDGWVTVLAATLGEEAFLDENGDGILTSPTISTTVPITTACPTGYTCECATAAGSYTSSVVSGATCTTGRRSEGFIDIGEPFYDVNDDNSRDNGLGTEPFELYIDSDNNGAYNAPNGMWDGPECETSGCLTSKTIWTSLKLVFSGHPYFYPWPDLNKNYGNPFASASGSFAVAPASITKGTAGNFMVIVGDENLNALEPGTVISASTDYCTSCISEPNSYTLPDGLSNGPTSFPFSVPVGEFASLDAINVTVTVVTPQTTNHGSETIYTTISVPLDNTSIGIANNTVLKAGKVGTAYSEAITATGGSGIYISYLVTAGSLPPGLDLGGLCADNEICGTPTGTSTQTYTFDVTVTDNAGDTQTKSLSITINYTALAITTSNATNLPGGLSTYPYNYTLLATGGDKVYTWGIVSGWPAGLSLGATDGKISGTPTTPGTYTFTVSLTDGAGTSVTKSFTVVIN